MCESPCQDDGVSGRAVGGRTPSHVHTGTCRSVWEVTVPILSLWERHSSKRRRRLSSSLVITSVPGIVSCVGFCRFKAHATRKEWESDCATAFTIRHDKVVHWRIMFDIRLKRLRGPYQTRKRHHSEPLPTGSACDWLRGHLAWESQFLKKLTREH